MMPLVLGCVWIVAANVLALIPSRDNHWFRAYVLIAIGIPLLIYIGYSTGWLFAVAFFLAGASVLRWPVVYLMRWLGRTTGIDFGRLGKKNDPE